MPMDPSPSNRPAQYAEEMESMWTILAHAITGAFQSDLLLDKDKSSFQYFPNGIREGNCSQRPSDHRQKRGFL
jgi:hypothetical protein